MCDWTKMKSITNTEKLSAYPEIQLVSLFSFKNWNIISLNLASYPALKKKKKDGNLSSTFIYAIMIHWFKMAALIAAFYFIA